MMGMEEGMKYRASLDQVMAWRPCDEYSREDIKKLFGRRKYVDVGYILSLDIPSADKIWACCHKEMFPTKTLRLLACDFAQHVLKYFETEYPDDKRPRNAIKVVRRYANGKATEQERDAAMDAARDAEHKYQIGRIKRAWGEMKEGVQHLEK